MQAGRFGRPITLIVVSSNGTGSNCPPEPEKFTSEPDRGAASATALRFALIPWHSRVSAGISNGNRAMALMAIVILISVLIVFPPNDFFLGPAVSGAGFSCRITGRNSRYQTAHQ